jgi:AraC family transcriptional regulator
MSVALDAGQFLGRTRTRHRKDGLVLSEIAHDHARALPSHTHESAYFSLLQSGSYEETWGARRLEYARGSIAFHPAALTHADVIGSTGGRFVTIEVGRAWLDKVADVAALDAEPRLLPPEIAWLARRALREAVEAAPGAAVAIEALVLEMLVASSRAADKAHPKTPDATRALEAVRADPFRRWTLEALAAECGMPPAALSRAIRKQTSKTLGAIALEARIQAAAELVRKDDRPLAEIARAAGFADQSHFTRLFRRVTGTTPGAWRDRN